MNNQIVIGVDVSKFFSNICIVSPTGDILCESKIYHDNTGLKYAVDTIFKFKFHENQKYVAVMESTAHYHRIVHQYFEKSGIDVIVINPLQSSSIKNLNIRKVKNDQTDAHRLAMMYMFRVLHNNMEDTPFIGALKDLTRQRADIVSEKAKFSNKLIYLLDQAFPGYRKVFCETRVRSSLMLLQKYPTPEAVLSARKDTLKKILGEGSGRGKNSKYAETKATQIIDTAKQAQNICIERTSFAPLISMYASMMMTLLDSAKVLEEQILSLAKSNDTFWNNVQLLTSIPGIGNFSATVILSEIGDISKFKKAKQLVAYAGLDPGVKQSGNMSKSSNKISKRGSVYLRKILDTCTHVAIHRCRGSAAGNPVLANFYQEKKKAKPPKVAQCACMRKMLDYIFAVLRDQKPFVVRSPDEHLALMYEKSTSTAA